MKKMLIEVSDALHRAILARAEVDGRSARKEAVWLIQAALKKGAKKDAVDSAKQ